MRPHSQRLLDNHRYNIPHQGQLADTQQRDELHSVESAMEDFLDDKLDQQYSVAKAVIHHTEAQNFDECRTACEYNHVVAHHVEVVVEVGV